MDETFEMLIALINGYSNLMIIKAYQSLLCGEYIHINLSKTRIKLILHVVYVTHFTIRKSKPFKRETCLLMCLLGLIT